MGGATSSDHTRPRRRHRGPSLWHASTDVARTLAPLVSTLGIGQIILEGIKGKRWVHVSTHTPERAINRIITITDNGVAVGIQPVD